LVIKKLIDFSRAIINLLDECYLYLLEVLRCIEGSQFLCRKLLLVDLRLLFLILLFVDLVMDLLLLISVKPVEVAHVIDA
jgi:hypothetical protein